MVKVDIQGLEIGKSISDITLKEIAGQGGGVGVELTCTDGPTGHIMLIEGDEPLELEVYPEVLTDWKRENTGEFGDKLG